MNSRNTSEPQQEELIECYLAGIMRVKKQTKKERVNILHLLRCPVLFSSRNVNPGRTSSDLESQTTLNTHLLRRNCPNRVCSDFSVSRCLCRCFGNSQTTMVPT